MVYSVYGIFSWTPLINQDVNDLFGADLPDQGIHFAWRDGPFLRALKNGHWILLDEVAILLMFTERYLASVQMLQMNLASQSVLEGLNACLDHRGEVLVPLLVNVYYIYI